MSATQTEELADIIVAAVRAATAPMLTKCAELEAQIKVLEARASVPGPTGPQGERGERGETGPKGHDGTGPNGPPGRDGVDGKDAPPVDVDALIARAAALIPTPKDGRDGADGRDGLNGKDAPAVDLEDVARRASVLVPAGKDGAAGRDGQPGVPGVPGRDGAPGDRGEKGADGKDGKNGTVHDLQFKLVPVTARSYQLYAGDGDIVEGGLITFDVPLYKGVYVAGANYDKSDAVTHGGSLWIAREPTHDKPGDGATAWQLAVKAGREGREGKPGKDGAPGPKGDRGDTGRNFS